MFEPIQTRRLLIRPLAESDAGNLAARRSDPQVAEYQNWPTPFPTNEALRIVNECLAMGGPRNDEWWMAAVVELESGSVIADVDIALTWDGRTAGIGYNFSPEYWGKGYATEAMQNLVDYLFGDLDVRRAFGLIHPDNVASAQVLERIGMLFEGHTRDSYWSGADVSDDHIYGMTREDWSAWQGRARHRPAQVELIEVGDDNWWDLYRLRTHKSQERFVAQMPLSFADALFPEVVDGAPVVPWMRAVEADGTLAGFVMLALATDFHPEPFLWRLLIDRLHQRRGLGTLAMDLVEETCRRMGADSLVTSWSEGRGSPRAFYLSRGFEPTGRLIDGETEGRKRLTVES
ncbi:MAG: GNAT family N-acetyltransferase [Acidimicrobiia bacterium]